MEEKQPLLSIIIPTYNEEECLPKLLRSIAAQTFRDFEIIVADNKSSDQTRTIARAYGATVVDGGRVARGRNNGAAVARGTLLLFLDADVVLPDIHFLEETVDEFMDRKLDVATCRIHPSDGNKSDKLLYGMYNVYTAALEHVLPHTPGFCVFARRSIHEAINGFDEQIKLAEDHDYSRRAAKIGKFGLLRSQYIPSSTRRFDRDGRVRTAIKYMLCEVYMLAVGPVTTDIFNYQWGHGKNKEKVR